MMEILARSVGLQTHLTAAILDVMDINSGSDSSNPGDNMAVVVGDTSISMPMMEAQDSSCGRMIPLTNPHGK